MTKLGKNNTPPNPLLFHHLLGYSKKKKRSFLHRYRFITRNKREVGFYNPTKNSALVACVFSLRDTALNPSPSE